MKKVKIFDEDSFSDLQKEINKFLKDDMIEIINIKWDNYSALVFYEELEDDE